jgi:ABC-type Fe3+/spermidine/putrescine transport system ATPase subunit
VMVRPERVVVTENLPPPTPDVNVLTARVTTLTFRGAHTQVRLDCTGMEIDAEVANLAGEPPPWLREDADVSVQISPNALRVLPESAG